MSLLWKLFLSFLQVGLFSVGGGYAAVPLIQSQIVDTYHLLTLEEFADLVTISEMTPGPIAVNAATFVGIQIAGLPGALICTFGCILMPVIICLILAHYYYKYRKLSAVQTVLSCMRPVVVSLIASAGLSILFLAIFKDGSFHLAADNLNYVEIAVFTICLLLLRKWKVSAVKIILLSGLAGVLVYLIPGLG